MKINIDDINNLLDELNKIKYSIPYTTDTYSVLEIIDKTIDYITILSTNQNQS